jgi:glycosyltransferase involved in cell wall biosynthesis
VQVIVPAGIDDRSRPSGGNVYDRRVIGGLTEAGWTVTEHRVPGAWPEPGARARSELAAAVAGIPAGSTVLVDGLIASCVPEVLVPAAAQFHLIVLVHMPLGTGSQPGAAEARRCEGAVFSSADAIVTTSEWSRRRVIDLYDPPPEKVTVATPGVDPAEPAPGSESGGELLCVAALTPAKGHDLLLDALAGLNSLTWRLTVVGSADVDPSYVESLRRQAIANGIGERVRFLGALSAEALDGVYRSADALVLASRAETYGMVITEALSHGLPVVVTDVGGVIEALGHTTDGRRPGLLVPAGDRVGLSAALRNWLVDAEVRRGLRSAASERRATLTGWDVTADIIGRILLAESVPVGAP